MQQQLNKPIVITSFIVILSTCVALTFSVINQPANNRTSAIPTIHGQYLFNAVALPAFKLVNQQHQDFTNSNLIGDWHLLSYGYLNCPDICPSTLLVLKTLHHELAIAVNTLKSKESVLTVPKIIFYSVDQRRDRPVNLQAYLNYFNEEFIGLTSATSTTASRILQQGLGIKSKVEYDNQLGLNVISHDVTLFLINPEGKLQAILKPYLSMDDNLPYFSSETLLTDVLKSMLFYQQTASYRPAK